MPLNIFSKLKRTYTSDVIQCHLFIVPRFIYEIKHVVHVLALNV